MQFRQSEVRTCSLLTLLFLLVFVGHVLAQSTTGVLRGQVTDPTGAVITDATVTAKSAEGKTATAVTNKQGAYEIKGLAPGAYTVTTVAPGFSADEQQNVVVTANQMMQINIALAIAVEEQKVNVQDEVTDVSVDPSSNASSVVLKGKDLEALSDDPDELESDLQALAGPSAGPNGGQIYIDGFSNATLPPKSSIREIRINQNPFSAQFDRLGFGRIEIFTKPGTDSFHGQFMANVNNSVFNSRNPFLDPGTNVPGYDSEMYNGNFSGPINSKSSFFLSFRRRNINETSIVTSTILDSSLAPQSFTAAVLNPRVRTEISPRIDYQITPNNTFTARYERESSTGRNNGIGEFSLPSLGYDSDGVEHNLQLIDTQVINSSTINETRFHFSRETSGQTAQNFAPTISVMDMFTDGGNSVGRSSETQDHYELQNYTSKVHGKHFIKFGGRLRYDSDVSNANSNYNGSFTFTSMTAYYLTQLPGITPAQSRTACNAYLSAIQSDPTSQPAAYSQFLSSLGLSAWPDNGVLSLPQSAADCGANQFTLTAGNPLISVSQFDAGLYAEDDWRVAQNVTLSYGLRFETQNNINDHADFAPRIGVAWGIGRGNSTPKTVLRAGVGVFYDRFGEGNVMRVRRADGVVQQNYICSIFDSCYPDFFPTVPSPDSLLTDPNYLPTIYRIDSKLQAPYVMQTAITLERQITRSSKLSVSYIGSRGLHQLVMENINAPLSDGVTRPYPGMGDIYQYQSAGVFKQNQLMANGNVQVGRAISLFGFYSLSYANSNTSGGFPSVPGDLSADWGRASFNARNRGMIGGSIAMPYGFRLSPFIVVSSGRPFNITLGQDLNGDNIYNDRPSFGDCSVGPLPSNLRLTPWGCFNLTPAPGDPRIPINFGNGPGQFITNLRVSKTFGFGKKVGAADGASAGAPGGHGPGFGGGHRHGGMFGGESSGDRYSLTFSASARNLFNHVNPASPIGNLSSSNFGESISLTGWGSTSANRRVDFQVRFSF